MEKGYCLHISSIKTWYRITDSTKGNMNSGFFQSTTSVFLSLNITICSFFASICTLRNVTLFEHHFVWTFLIPRERFWFQHQNAETADGLFLSSYLFFNQKHSSRMFDLIIENYRHLSKMEK